MMASQALTNVTALSKRSLNQNEPDSILAASTAIGTLRGRAKMDAMNKSARSGLYSTIGRNAKMPDDDDDDEENEDVAPVNSQSRAQSVAASRKSLASNNVLENAKSQMSLAKSAKSSRSVAQSAISQGRHSTAPSGTQFSSNQRSRDSRSQSRDSRSQVTESKSHASGSRSRSRTRSRMSEDYSKSNLSISETNLSETNLSMSESQYSQSAYSNSQYSRTRSEYSDEDSYNSRSTIQSRR
jgi:hypothetical protein